MNKFRLASGIGIIAFLLSGQVVASTIYAQDASPSASPTPLAHLTFRTCLIPDTTSFRLSFRADYEAGEYRVVGQNSGFTLNLGYLELNQEGGGFGEDNTQYVLPYEDTWIKQWYNGTRWQRSGGLPVTSVQDHIDRGLICEVGAKTPYEQTVQATPTPTPTSQSSGVGGVSANEVSQPTPTPTPTPSPTPQVASDKSVGRGGRVAGATTLSDTGDNLYAFIAATVMAIAPASAYLLRLSKKSLPMLS
jgi:hypothetical protein